MKNKEQTKPRINKHNQNSKINDTVNENQKLKIYACSSRCDLYHRTSGQDRGRA